jgi:prevent-host-death family protein
MATTLSSREFNQNSGKVKKAVKDGPVFITDRGKPMLVVLDIEDYQKLTGKQKSLADLISMPADDTIEFEPERIPIILRDVDFS